MSGSTTTTYTYDGDGVRQQTSTGSAASAKTNFVWDINQPNAQVALERNGSNTLQRQYIYGLKRIRQTVGTASYFHTDQLGSVTNTTSASGASQRTWTYEPYGVIRTSTGTSPTNFVNFTGEYLDPTGLYHLRARQYDPASGGFLGLDPLERPDSEGAVSQYSYADARPLVFVDPSGMGRTLASNAGTSAAASVGSSADGTITSSKVKVFDGQFGFYSFVAYARVTAISALATAAFFQRDRAGLRITFPAYGGSGLFDPVIIGQFNYAFAALKIGVEPRAGYSFSKVQCFGSPLCRGKIVGDRTLAFTDSLKSATRDVRCAPPGTTTYSAKTERTTLGGSGIAGWEFLLELRDRGGFGVGRALPAQGQYGLISALVCDVLKSPGAIDRPRSL